MSAEWRQVSLLEVTSALGDGLHGTPEYDSNGDYFFINGNNLSNGKIIFNDSTKRVSAVEAKKHRKNLTDRTILVSINGTLGNVAFYAGEKVVLGKSACYFNVVEGVDKYFIRYILASEKFQGYIQNLATGSTIKNVSLKLMRDFKFSLPSIDLQQQVSGILSRLDDRITLLRESNATLEAIAQALFKSWFVDFDPVRANIARRSREGGNPDAMGSSEALDSRLRENDGTVLDEATARLFPDSFEESALGLVPRGWRVDSVYAVTTLVYGAAFASKQFNSSKDGVPLIRIRDLRDEAPGVFTPEVHPKGYMVQPGDIVVGMDGEFRAYLWGGEPAWLNQRVCVFSPKADRNAAFIHRSIMPLLAAVEASETATTVIHLGKNDIDRFRILIPDDHVLTSFGQLTDGLYSQIVSNKQCARTLAALRDTLLPRLISGKLQLNEIGYEN